MEADEANVEQNFVNSGLSCSRFSKAEMRRSTTPDFRVNKNDEFVFFCEVKTSKKDTWLEEQLQKVRVGCIAGGLRNDPIFNRLTDDIYKAAKQFDAVNPDQKFPNVLAIVNHDKNCGFLDLLSVLTGNFYADDGSVHPIYAQYSEGRIKEKKDRIHLYIWIDEFNPKRLLFSQTVEAHHSKLCELFGFQPNDIKQIKVT
jgi:hypothetical protein